MNKRTEALVELYFEGIPFSKETGDARKNIKAFLQAEYEKLTDSGIDENSAFEAIVKKYPGLADAALPLGCSRDDIDLWRAEGTAQSIRDVKKTVKRQRRKIYGISFLLSAAAAELMWFVYGLFLSPVSAIWAFLLSCVLLGGGIFLCHSFKRTEKECETEKYSPDSYRYLCTLYDRYIKRSANGIALAFSVFFLFIIMELCFFFFGNSKLSELIENIFSNMILIELLIYICAKNLLSFRLFQNRVRHFDGSVCKKHLTGIFIFSVTYWIAATVSAVIIGGIFNYYVNIILAAGFVFSVMIFAYNFTLRKRITFNNLLFNKKRVAIAVSAAMLVSGYSFIQRDTWYTQPYINSLPVVAHNEHSISYDEDSGIYTIVSSSDDFKILHLTDIHLGGSLYSYSKDMKALKAVYAEIEYTHPDLVIVTGDLTFPLGIMSLSLNNSAPVSQFAAFMRNIGIPWAFTYGNHDTESIATLSTGDLNELYKSLSYKTSGTLLYPYTQPDITGRNNQLIEIRNDDGTLNQAIFLIDSNAYTGEGINVYDYIRDDQVQWYENHIKRLECEAAHSVSSMVFFHIPLQEYRTAYELYENGSDEVKYFFGENGEKMIDKVCCSDYPSRLFDTMLELGSTKAVFCGHDHYNNMSLEYKGIRLTYGMSIDYLAMPGIENDTAQRGAELITVHSDSSWDITQIPLENILNEK